MTHDWLSQGQFFGNSTLAWIIAGVAALLGYIVAQGFALFLGARLRKLADRTQRRGLHVAADVVAATRGWLLLLIAIVAALGFLHLGATSAQGRFSPHWWLRIALFTLVGVQLALWISRLLVSWLNRAANRDAARPVNPVILGVLKWGVQFIVWVTLVLAVLSEASVNITAFVASLGVGGVAVALALQNVLGDMFASVAIGLDKPFEVGDYIGFGAEQGTVKRVGVKSTRILSLAGEELSVSNAVLLQSPIHNYSRRQERRILFTFRLPFDTPRDKLPVLNERVRAIIEAEDQTRFDRGYLSSFGQFGLEFEFVYFVLVPDYNVYVAIQQRINLAMLAACDELGIELATPGTAAGGQSIAATPS